MHSGRRLFAVAGWSLLVLCLCATAAWPQAIHEGKLAGKVAGEELFTAKELTVNPGVKVTIKDNGAYGLITVQGSGRIGKLPLQTPALIRFGELTEDEVFVTHDAARQGVVFENTGTEPLVTLRYFGPDTNPGAPGIGDYRKK